MLDASPGRRLAPFPSTSGLGRWSITRAILLGLLLTAIISAVLLVDLLPSNQVLLNVGDVSSQDLRAPYDLTYESAIETKKAQDAQAASVAEVYDPPDITVARQQEVKARQTTDYISTVREDAYAATAEKIQWIAAVPDLTLTEPVIAQILQFDQDEWDKVRSETINVLVRAMQGEIRESQVTTTRRRLPTLISHTLTDDQASAIRELAGSLVTANTFYNAARTEENRQKARDSVPPVPLTIRQGETIIRAGDRVTPLNVEILDAFGLRQQATRWESIVGAIALSIITSLLMVLLIFRFQPQLWARGRASLVTILLVALFVILGKLMLPLTDSVVPYLYPLPALSMIVSILFGPVLGLGIGAVVGLIGSYMAGGSSAITLYLIAGTWIGAIALGQAERLKAFFRSGIAVALTNAAVILLFGLLGADQDIVRTGVHALVGIVSGGTAASLALACFFALSALLDVVTPFQLMELSRPTHPLFRQLLLKAPGTYHHTLLVANMGEEAAERIGADGLLTRVGTYYHDIGKTLRPYFFAENRVGSVNPHERLDPRTSAQIVISHVTDGLELAERYNLPSAIRAFIPEHHGTGMALSFYRMAVKAAEESGETVAEEDFSYPGPKPRSKETAITMLADNCEARIRSAEPASIEEMDRLIAETIKARLDQGQLDESDLTLRDLSEIRAAFLSVLKGVFHPRVKYPEPVKVKGPDGKEIIR